MAGVARVGQGQYLGHVPVLSIGQEGGGLVDVSSSLGRNSVYFALSCAPRPPLSDVRVRAEMN
jgi:hypothetical protein